MRALHLLGFKPVRQSGSHLFFQHFDGRNTLVPIHGGEEMGKGLIKQILRETQISAEEFVKYL